MAPDILGGLLRVNHGHVGQRRGTSHRLDDTDAARRQAVVLRVAGEQELQARRLSRLGRTACGPS